MPLSGCFFAESRNLTVTGQAVLSACFSHLTSSRLPPCLPTYTALPPRIAGCRRKKRDHSFELFLAFAPQGQLSN